MKNKLPPASPRPARLAAALLLLALAACSPLRDTAAPSASPAPPAVTAPPPVPAAPADPLASLTAQGPSVLKIDPASSLIAMMVRRGGSLARFGHDHVVASRSVSGQVDLQARRSDFSFRLDQLSVDEPGLRQDAGLDTQPDADAIAGTRRNMLVKVLDAERYPLVQVQAALLSPEQPLQVRITLHGVTRTLPVPVSWQVSAGRLTVAGNLQLRQTDFGLTPYSLLGGALAVQDLLELRFHISAGP